MLDVARFIRKLLVILLKSVKKIEHSQRRLTKQTRSLFLRSLPVPRWIFVLFTLMAILLVLIGPEAFDFKDVVGYFFLTLGFIILLGFYLFYYARHIYSSNTKLIILESVSVLIVVLGKVFHEMGLSGYLIPVGLVSILMVILVDIDLAILMTLVLDIFIALIYQNDFTLFVVLLISGFVGIFSASAVRQRGDLIRSGLLISITNVFSVICFTFLLQHDSMESVAYNSIWGILNGFLCGVLGIGFLPYFEYMFGISSNIKLLELCDFNQPLLKRLMLEAPGTYHHSLLVGNLAQNAAAVVGANSLLARAGAYYHDIGKLSKPEYFIENQESFNRHDELSPSMSNLIVLAHVKEGVELAQEYKLSQDIVEIIEQHHGTSLMFFFYQRALEEEVDPVKEQYRYPGPKPQSREAAIILLADAVEAASRVMETPSYAHIQELVMRIINNKFIDGQLDDCNLTLKDLHNIGKEFSTVLRSMFHSRIEYPHSK